MIRFINTGAAQNPYMYGTLSIRNNYIKNDPRFDAKLFDCLDESLCVNAIVASDIDRELIQNGVSIKTLKECFAGSFGTDSGTCRGKDKRFFIEHTARSIDENNYVFTVTYKTPNNEVKISYNTKDKLTASETWMNGEQTLKASSKFCPKDNTVAEEIFFPPGGSDPGCVIRQKYRKAQKGHPLTQEGILLNSRGGAIFKVFCDYGNSENYTRYVARTIYPESPDKEKTLQFTAAAAATKKSNIGICEARFTDKNAEEWICVFAPTADGEMKEKYFKRDLDGFLKIFIGDAFLFVPYPDRVPETIKDLDAVCVECFGCCVNGLLAWIRKQMDFFAEKIIPAQKGPAEIMEYYDTVKDYK